MAVSIWQSNATINGSLSAGTTRYFQLGSGDSFRALAEAKVEHTHRTAGTLSKFYVLISANSIDAGTTTVYVRKNRADGNQTVSIGFGATGEFRDDSNTDAVVAGDETDYSVVVSGASGTLFVRVFNVLFAASSNTVTRFIGSTSHSVAASASYYRGLTQDKFSGTSTTEANTQHKFSAAGTLKNAGIYINANTVSATSTLKSRINTANGGISVSITASTTGYFEDTSGTDTIAANDLVCSVLTAGGSGTSITPYGHSFEFESTAGKTPLIAGDIDGLAFASPTTRYEAIVGDLGGGTTESLYRAEIRADSTLSDLRFYVSANTASQCVVTVRKNGADTTLTASSGTGTGWFEDVTHTVTVVATDECCLSVVSTSGTCTITSIGCIATVGGATANFKTVSCTATGTATVTRKTSKAISTTATGTATVARKTSHDIVTTATGTATLAAQHFDAESGAALPFTSYEAVANWTVPTPVSGSSRYARRFWVYWGGATSGDTSGGLTYAVYQKGASLALTSILGTQSSRFANLAVGEPTVWTDITSAITTPVALTGNCLMAVNPINNSVGGAVTIHGFNDATSLNASSALGSETLPANLTGWSTSSRRYLAYFEHFVLTQYRLYANAAFSLPQPHTAVGGASRLLNIKHSPYAEPDDQTRYNQNLTTGDGLPQILTDTHDLDTFTIPTGYKVSSVVVHVRAKYTTSGFVSAKVAPVIRIGSTSYLNATGDQNLITSIAEYSGGGVWGGAASAEKSPATGLDWTQTEINSLRAGYRTTGQDDGIGGTVDIRVYHCTALITLVEVVDTTSLPMTLALATPTIYPLPTTVATTATGTATVTTRRPSSHKSVATTATGAAIVSTIKTSGVSTSTGFQLRAIVETSGITSTIEPDGLDARVEPKPLTEVL